MIKAGIWYCVTNGSGDGDVEVGDQVYLSPDATDSRLVIRSKDKLDIGQHTEESLTAKGVVIEIDKKWYAARIKEYKGKISECQKALQM